MPQPPNYLALPVSLPLQVYPGAGRFSWTSELRHLSSYKVLNITWWPVFKYRQRWFTHSGLFASCKKLPGFTDLWRTIQKGAFAYNTLFFKMSPFHRPATDLADITTLALFFGDEFIDGLSAAAGKPFIRQLLHNDPDLFYLQTKTGSDKPVLHYQFDLSLLLPQEVMQQVNSKYGISYQRFYGLLQQFLQLINECLSRLPIMQAEKVAAKIADTCNTCVDSLLHDINSCPAPGNIGDLSTVLHFHESKTAFMQKKLLGLRCILANKEQLMKSTQAVGWMDIMRVIQIYDDIQDTLIDDGLQDNILLSIACHYFPGEWKWFCNHKHLLEQAPGQSSLLSLYMPGSIEYCLQLASDKIKTMNWEQQKIMHYLLFKHQYYLYEGKGYGGTVSIKLFLLQFYRHINERMPHLQAVAVKSFIIDTCIHLTKEKKQLLRKVNFSTAYQLRYNLLSMPAEKKALLFDKVTAK